MMFNGGGVKVLDDFTDNRDELLTSLQKLIVGDAQGDRRRSPMTTAMRIPARLSDRTSGEFNIFTTDRQLSALQTAVKMLGQLNEKKSLIYFASGMRLNGVDNQAQLQATINSAIRANVSL